MTALILSGSTKVGVKTAAAIFKCKMLKTLNLNYTSVPPASLVPIFLDCLDMEVLKLAALPKLVLFELHSLSHSLMQPCLS